jgi:alpha-L-fucosidase 2
MKLKNITLVIGVITVLVACSDENYERLPPSECNLFLSSPLVDWYEGIPLGNGQLGALIWGQENQIIVKLDRLDIWDERFDPGCNSMEFTWRNLKKNVDSLRSSKRKDLPEEKINPGYSKKSFWGSSGFNNPPAHVSIGKLLVTMPKKVMSTQFTLDLARAEAGIQFKDGKKVTAFAASGAPVIMMQISGKPEGLKMWAPGKEPKWPANLGYPEPVLGSDADDIWYEQSIPEGSNFGYSGDNIIPEWKFVVFAASRTKDDKTLIAMTITSSQKDGADPLAAARVRVHKALETGYKVLSATTRKHWSEFWNSSSVNIPDTAELRHYYLSRYYLGASSDTGYPAMGVLQSIWTDNRFPVPAFRNNLHNDLETQVQYQSYQVAGNFAEGRVFLEYLWNMLPTWRRFARSFYETGGAAMPSVMSLGGNPTGGWPQYQLSPTFAGWFGWLFYEHWRYTHDRDFLETRAYPWCTEIARCWCELLKEDKDGILKLPLSSSAEIFDQTLRAWLKPNSNQDHDLMQMHFLGLAEMADVLGKTNEAAQWRDIAAKLGPLHVDDENVLMWSENEKLAESHRHFSATMNIYPFNLLTVEGSDRDKQIITATMKRYDDLGTIAWAGWSWPWMSSLRSRAGDAESAYKYLDIFVKGFITRNGFYTNTDLHAVVREKPGKPGGLFTIEGNMMANQSVHDLLIQSWAPAIGQGEPGIIRLFPSTPWSWHESSFEDLRAEGGFRVSARREKNVTVWFRIKADAEGLVRLRDNFGGRQPRWIGKEMTKVGENFERQLKKGEIIEATLETPKVIPASPDNLYVPVIIKKY